MTPTYEGGGDRMQRAIKPKRERLAEIEAEYLRTRDYLKTPAWQRKRDQVLESLGTAIGSFKGRDALEAVFILGQCKQIILEVQKPLDVIDEYESLKESIKRIEEAGE